VVLDERVVEKHFIEEGEVDAADCDGSMEIFGKAGGHFRNEPVLDRGKLNEDPSRY
jgi:hypothetical protein